MGIQTIGIIGAGIMGNGIAQVCAQAGIQTIMQDVAEAALERGMKTISAYSRVRMLHYWGSSPGCTGRWMVRKGNTTPRSLHIRQDDIFAQTRLNQCPLT